MHSFFIYYTYMYITERCNTMYFRINTYLELFFFFTYDGDFTYKGAISDIIPYESQY